MVQENQQKVDQEPDKASDKNQEPDKASDKERKIPWGSYSLGTALIMCWFFAEFLRAGYGAVIHFSGTFGSNAMGVGLLVFGLCMIVATTGLLFGNKRGVQIALMGLFVSLGGHAAFVLGYGAQFPLFEVVMALLATGAGARYLMSENTAHLALQPKDPLAIHVKVLSGFITGFGLLCLAALILIMWEPYGQVPLGVP